jgi:hypothetical protein
MIYQQNSKVAKAFGNSLSTMMPGTHQLAEPPGQAHSSPGWSSIHKFPFIVKIYCLAVLGMRSL